MWVEKRDGELGVGQGGSGNPRRHKRARCSKPVVCCGAEPAKGLERQSDPLEIGIGRINELEPGERVHIVAERQREGPACPSAPSTSCGNA